MTPQRVSRTVIRSAPRRAGRGMVAGFRATPRLVARTLLALAGLPRLLARAVGDAARAARRNPRRALAHTAAVAALTAVAGGLAQLGVQTGMDSFLPSDDPAATQFDAFARDFGGDPIVVLLETDTARALLTPDALGKLVSTEGELSRLPDVAAVYGPGTVLNQIAGQTQDLLAELSGRRDAERVRAEQKAKDAGAGPAEVTRQGDAAAGTFDERYASLLAQGLPAGLPTLKNPSFAATVVFGPDGAGTPGSAPRPQWRFVIPSEKSVAILVRPREELDAAGAAALAAGVRDVAGKLDLGAGVPVHRTVSGVPAVVAELSDRTQRSAPLLGGIAVAAVAGCLLLVRWTERRRRLVPLLTTLTAIAVVLAGYGWLGQPVSLGVVAFLSVVLGVGCYYPTYLMLGAARRTVLTVAAATALSFATLLLSPLPLVRDLGVTLAAGVLVAAGVGLLAPRPADGSSGIGPGPAGQGGVPAAAVHRRGRRFAVAGLIALTVAAGVGWAALPAIGLRTDVTQFAAGLPGADEAEHVEDVIGSSGEVALVLRGADSIRPEAYAWMQQARDSVITRYGDQLRAALSPPALLSFLGPSPTAEQIASGLRLLPRYLTGAVLSPDHSTAILSFGMRLDRLDDLGAAQTDLMAGLPPVPPGYDVELVGLPVTALRGAELVDADRVWANVLGLVAAGLVLAVGLPRRRDAVVAVVAATLATGSGLFLLWLTGSELSPLTIALGSLTAAVGCEFSVVLAESARRRARGGLRRAVPLLAAVSAVGYGALMLSDLQIVREFGVQLAAAVLLSVISAQLVLRALPPRLQPTPTTPTAPTPTTPTPNDDGAPDPTRAVPTLVRS
ncbi:RND transporter [Pseudonocardia halophobica]|uniref:RND transporter n=1 Tax=Pseudonocardia halophobica TaxID=29401 RepID=UPI003D8E755F